MLIFAQVHIHHARRLYDGDDFGVELEQEVPGNLSDEGSGGKKKL